MRTWKIVFVSSLIVQLAILARMVYVMPGLFGQ